jgi:Holliday junction resolvase RusA-like endonuclease
MTLSFTIPGAPRTKKNHGRLVRAGGRHRLIPSAAFGAWNAVAQVHLLKIDTMPLLVPVNCRALFYRDALRGDAVGYYQALADALEEARIVENDALIVQWDGSRLLKDAANPRIEVTLETL